MVLFHEGDYFTDGRNLYRVVAVDGEFVVVERSRRGGEDRLALAVGQLARMRKLDREPVAA